ncbi:MAG: NAD(P)-dependent oxidoreductase [Nodosilinea sp.]
MKIGVMGTGLMGAPMALTLVAAGHEVWAHNRTPARLEPLAQAGISVCQTPSELVIAVEVIIVMVTNAQAIQTLLLDDLETAAAAALAGRTIIQMGTIAPAESQMFHQRLTAAGATYLEAPVLGSIPEAKTGQLIVMVGAEADQYQRWQPLLASLGKTYHTGPVGTAAALKLAMNQLIGGLTAAFAQSLGLVQQSGLEVETFMAVVRQSALYAPTFDKKLGRMQSRNFAEPNFPTRHLLKDMNLFIDAAQTAGLDTRPAEGVRQVLDAAVQAGLADDDYAALFNIVSPSREAG